MEPDTVSQMLDILGRIIMLQALEASVWVVCAIPLVYLHARLMKRHA